MSDNAQPVYGGRSGAGVPQDVEAGMSDNAQPVYGGRSGAGVPQDVEARMSDNAQPVYGGRSGAGVPQDTAARMLSSLGERRNMREEIIETLRGAVISGELRPGVVYSAPSLAEQFGVSATPVREAMLDLAKEGLVVTVRNKGFRITELSEHDLDGLTELRTLIEVPTVRRIAEAGVRGADISRLRPLAAGIEDAARRHDLIAHVTIDLQFHLTLLGLAGNEHLVEVVRSLRARSRIYGLKALAERDQLVPSSREHAELLDLVEARDADGAERLMRRHIGHVRGIWAGERA